MLITFGISIQTLETKTKDTHLQFSFSSVGQTGAIVFVLPSGIT